MEALWQMTLSRLRHFRREPEAMFWVFIFPLALALVLGLAFRDKGTQPLRAGTVEGSLAVEWVAALEVEEQIELQVFSDEDELVRKLRSGAVDVALSGQEKLVGRWDPARQESEVAWRRSHEVIQIASGRVDVVESHTEMVSEKGARYIDFLLPGLLGMNLMGTGIWSSGYAIVDFRQKKLLKLLLATPMRRGHFLLAQMLSRLVFLFFEVAAITGFGVFALGVPFRGGVGPFAALCLTGAACFSGLGLLVASRARTLEGVSGLMNLIMMPMWLLSGVFFSYERFPEAVHPVLQALPLTVLNDGLRSSMLEGSPANELLLPLITLIAWAVVCFAVALKVFRWR